MSSQSVKLKNAIKHYSEAQAAWEKGQQETAISLLGKALELDPDSYKYNYSLGTCLAISGKFAEAVAPLQKSLEIYPGYEFAKDTLEWCQRNLAGQTPAQE